MGVTPKKSLLAGYLDDMEPELGLYRADHFTNLFLKGNRLELGDHHPLAEPAEVSPVLPGRAGRESPGYLVELFAIRKALHDLLCLLFGFDEDMGCASLCCHAVQVPFSADKALDPDQNSPSCSKLRPYRIASSAL